MMKIDGFRINGMLEVDRSVIRETFGKGFITFWKSKFSENSTDFYEKLGLFFYYDKSNRTKGIEIIEPANPTFNGFEIIGKLYYIVEKFFLDFDPDLVRDDAGFDSVKLGIGIYCPNPRSDSNNLVESVYISKPKDIVL